MIRRDIPTTFVVLDRFSSGLNGPIHGEFPTIPEVVARLAELEAGTPSATLTIVEAWTCDTCDGPVDRHGSSIGNGCSDCR